MTKVIDGLKVFTYEEWRCDPKAFKFDHSTQKTGEINLL
jgi:hypothetical protein